MRDIDTPEDIERMAVNAAFSNIHTILVMKSVSWSGFVRQYSPFVSNNEEKTGLKQLIIQLYKNDTLEGPKLIF